MRISLISIIMLLIAFNVAAQSIEQNQPDIIWKIIKTENFKIIFPEYIEKDAQIVANTMEYLREPLGKTLDVKMTKWPLIMSTNGAMANGYVTLAPKRSEWYSSPPQGTFVGTGEWYNLLAVHEGRHMAQYDKMDHGLTRFLHVLFGQSIANGLSFLSVPSWYWEGDAVGTETALTSAGRGRVPSFDMHVRTMLLNDQKQNFYKAAGRSLKDYYPNHYVLGYHMTTHLKRNYPTDSWSTITRRTANFSVSPFRFSRMMKKTTGFNARQTFNNSLAELDTLWRDQIKDLSFTDVKIIRTKKKKVRTNYTYVVDAGNYLICRKGSMADAYQFVKFDITTGEESRIRQAAAYDKYSYANGWLCWNEYHLDHRYVNQNYSNIVLYHLDTAKTIYLTSKQRYFSPVLDPNAENIAVVEFTNDRKCNLVLINRKSQKETTRFLNPENYFIQNPNWDDKGERIVYIKQKYNGKALAYVNTTSGEEIIVIPESFENISNPIFYKNYVIYESDYSGIDNIYAIDINTKKRFQITSRKFGASMPSISIDQTLLYFSDYNLMGYDIASMPLNPTDWNPIENVEVRTINYAKPLISQEQGKSILDGMTDVPTKEYEVKDYKQFLHLLNIHDWNIIPGVSDIQLAVTSTDLLNTTRISLGTNYHMNENAFNTFFDFSYAKYYPIFTGGFSLGERYVDLLTDSDLDSTDTWNETAINLDITLPFVCTRGNWSKQAYGKIGAAYTNITGKMIPETNGEINGTFIPVNYRVHFSNSYTSPIRDLHPKYHMAFDLNFNHTPFKGDYTGQQISFNTQFFLPGLAKHHSTVIEARIENQNPGNYYFSSDVLFARGYNYKYHDQYKKLALGYELPLLYPDMHLGVLFFLRRISAGIFYDYSLGITGTQEQEYSSASLELKGNFTVLNIPTHLEAGIRTSYRFMDGKYNFNFLFLDIAL